MKAKTGRRFWLTLGGAVTYTVLFILGYLDGGQYVTLQSLTIGAYLAANGHQKYTEHKFNAGNPL